MGQKSLKDIIEERTTILDRRVWNELYDAKKYDYYLAGYLSALRTRKKRINISTVVISVLAIAAEKWLKGSTFFTLIGLTLLQLLKDVIPFIAADDKLIDKLPEYRMLYVQKFELLDKLYFDMQNGTITEEKAKLDYFRIKEMNTRIQEVDNSIHLPEKKEIFQEAERKAYTYMNNFFDLEQQ